MGYYINPPEGTKEEWLVKHGVGVTPGMVREWDFKGDYLPVCLVQNPSFTAAGIAYDKDEAQVFLAPDSRPRRWFSVSRADLAPYYPGR